MDIDGSPPSENIPSLHNLLPLHAVWEGNDGVVKLGEDDVGIGGHIDVIGDVCNDLARLLFPGICHDGVRKMENSRRQRETA